MKIPWFTRNPKLLDDIRDVVVGGHPDLRVMVENGIVFVRGTYRLMNRGEILDWYQIEIEFPSLYPDSMPVVRETGGRIPRLADRHVIPSSGNACLVVEEDWLVAVAGKYSFAQFMDGPVRNYFLGQSLVEAGRPWPHGDRSHGVPGLLEVLAEWFGTNDRDSILRYLLCFTKDKIKGHWACPCGSGEPIRRCHLDQVRELQRRLTPALARRSVLRLMGALEAEAKARHNTVRR